ncbi:hypothetical protein WJX82_003626 [Trebouxia sp. C0006]
MIYRPMQPSATAKAGWNDVPLPVMAQVFDGMPAQDIWPLRAVGSVWAHSITAFELSIPAEDHNIRAQLSAIYRCRRNYPLADFVLRLSEIMSFCQAARLLLMVIKLGDRLPSVQLGLPMDVSDVEAGSQLGPNVDTIVAACTWLQERGVQMPK